MKSKIIFCILIVSLLSACQSQPAKQANSELSVKTSSSKKDNIETSIDLAGILAPNNTENINSKLNGLVKTVNLEVGKKVTPGDILIELDTKDLQNQLAQAKAAFNVIKDQATVSKTNLDVAQDGVSTAQDSVESAKKSLSATKSSISDQISQAKVNLDAAQKSVDATKSAINDQINQAKINVESAQSSLDSISLQNKSQLEQVELSLTAASDAYNRSKSLFDSRVISQVEFDNAKKAFDNATAQKQLVESSSNTAIVAAQAKLDSAKVALQQATGSGSNSQLVAAQAKLDSARVSLQQASGSGSNSQIVAAQNAVTNAESGVKAALSKTETAKKQYEVSSSSSVEQAQVAINTVLSQIENATIRPHISGVVINKNIHIGELAQAGATLASIADISKLKLSSTISQETIPFIKIGDTVSVSVDIYPGEKLVGKITSIGPISVSSGSYFPIEITIDNADQHLMAGLSAHASINIKKSNSIIVPSSAIVENNGAAYLFTVENGIAIKKQVVLGLKTKDSVEILSGLNESEKVVTTNVNALFDKLPIKEIS